MKKLFFKTLEFISRPDASKILRGIFFLSSEKLLKLTIGVVVQSLIARFLGPEKFGLINYAVNTVLVFSLFITLGLDEYLIRHLVSEKINKNKEQLLSAAIGLRSIAMIFSYVVIFALIMSDFFNSKIVQNYVIIFSIVLIIQPLITFESKFFSETKNHVIFKTRFLGYLSGTIVKIISLLFRLNPLYFLSSYIVEEFVGKLYLARSFFQQYNLRIRIPSITELLQLAKNTYPVMLLTLIISLDSRLGFQFARLIPNPSALGFFSVSFTLIDALTFIGLAITTSTFPKLIETREFRHQEYEIRTTQLFALCFWSGVFLTVCVYAASGLVVKLLFGPRYYGADVYLDALSILIIPIFINAARTKFFILQDSVLKWALLNLASSILSLTIIFNMEIVSIYKIVLAIIVSQLVSNIFASFIDSDIRLSCRLILKGLIEPFRLLSKWAN